MASSATFKMTELKGFVKNVTSPKYFNSLKSGIRVHLEKSTKQKIATGDTLQKVPLSGLTKKLRRKGSSIPLSDTGKLRMSVKGFISGNQILTGSPLKQAKILNDGGIIKRSGGDGFLYLPANKDAKTKSAVQGIKAYLESLKKSGWRIWWAKGAVLGLSSRAIKRTKGSDKNLIKKYTTPIFWLKKEINIPSRTYLYLSDNDNKSILKLWKTATIKAGEKKNV